MKPFSYYSTIDIKYPKKLDYVKIYVYDKGKVICSVSNRIKSELKNQFPGAVIQEILDEESFKADLKKYNSQYSQLKAEFKEDLFKEFDVNDNPKRELCFELAANFGTGYEEIYDKFSELVELIY